MIAGDGCSNENVPVVVNAQKNDDDNAKPLQTDDIFGTPQRALEEVVAEKTPAAPRRKSVRAVVRKSGEFAVKEGVENREIIIPKRLQVLAAMAWNAAIWSKTAAGKFHRRAGTKIATRMLAAGRGAGRFGQIAARKAAVARIVASQRLRPVAASAARRAARVGKVLACRAAKAAIPALTSGASLSRKAARGAAVITKRAATQAAVVASRTAHCVARKVYSNKRQRTCLTSNDENVSVETEVVVSEPVVRTDEVEGVAEKTSMDFVPSTTNQFSEDGLREFQETPCSHAVANSSGSAPADDVVSDGVAAESDLVAPMVDPVVSDPVKEVEDQPGEQHLVQNEEFGGEKAVVETAVFDVADIDIESVEEVNVVMEPAPALQPKVCEPVEGCSGSKEAELAPEGEAVIVGSELGEEFARNEFFEPMPEPLPEILEPGTEVMDVCAGSEVIEQPIAPEAAPLDQEAIWTAEDVAEIVEVPSTLDDSNEPDMMEYSSAEFVGVQAAEERQFVEEVVEVAQADSGNMWETAFGSESYEAFQVAETAEQQQQDNYFQDPTGQQLHSFQQPVQRQRESVWVQLVDQTSGEPYYWNRLTNETRWELPVWAYPSGW